MANKHICVQMEKTDLARFNQRLDCLRKRNLSTATSKLETHSPGKIRLELLKTKQFDPQHCHSALMTKTKNKSYSLRQTIAASNRHDENSDAPNCHVHSACIQYTSAQPLEGVGGMA